MLMAVTDWTGASPGARAFHVRAQTCNPIARSMPVSEYFYTQLGPGRFEVDMTASVVDEVVLNRTRIEALSAGVVVPDPAYVAFVLPLRWEGRYLFNGAEVTASSLCISGGRNGYHTHGASREGMVVALPRSRLIETVAALRGVHPQEIRLGDGILNVPAPVVAGLRERLVTVLAQTSGARGSSLSEQERRNFTNEVYQLIIDAYLDARPDAGVCAQRVSRQKEIVRRAEERFVAAGDQPVSLADLCAAAGVGRTALQLAFQGLYDESPLGYFRKRRLMQARETLVLAPPERAAVKRAALGAGLNALGRFSVEYRLLFGERPSATLRDASA